MTSTSSKFYGKLSAGVVASMLIHVFLLTGLVMFAPREIEQPETEDAVSVELVPPPEEPQKQEPQKEQAEKPDDKPAGAPETAKAEEPAVPEKADEGEPAPEPQAAEEQKPEEAEKPKIPDAEKPPEPPPEQAQAPQQQEPPPQPEPPVQSAAEPPPGAPQEGDGAAAAGIPIPVLRPAVAFAEKDSGPQKALDGTTASKAEETETDKPTETAAASPPLPELALPGVEAQSTDASPRTDPEGDQSSPADADASLAFVPEGRPADDPAREFIQTADGIEKLSKATKLYSETSTNAVEATTAIGSLPRGARVNRLCLTELREQLRHGTPRYTPEFLPAYKPEDLEEGTVFTMPNVAFRAGAAWYNLAFRCEVDEGGTRVRSFAYKVGTPIPKSEWRKRGFPAF